MRFKTLSNVSNIDLRSENEFKKGSIPSSINIPILTNDQFKKVGIEYKNNGSAAAVLLGHSLVKQESKKKLIKLWAKHLKANPGSVVFCFRGGMRSEIAVKWLREYGLNVERLAGGYKNFRNRIVTQHINIDNYKNEWIIIGGLTGSGKTEFLKSFKESIDLEGIANHRGSAFGGKKDGQPSQANFENILTMSYLNHGYNHLILEDESRTIGRTGLPDSWYQKMQTSKLIILEVGNDKRAENIYYEYIYEELKNGCKNDILQNKYLRSLKNINRRLGDKVYNEIKNLMENAFVNNDKDVHKKWILMLLTNYYDKMYNYKLELRNNFIAYRGTNELCREYINSII